jgi:hypothetical protein
MARPLVALAAVATLALAGCGSHEASPGPHDLDHPPKVAAEATVRDGGVDPATVPLTLGRALRIVNHSGDTVRLSAAEGAYDTGRMPDGGTVTIVPGRAGRLVLVGSDRPDLRLVVVVRTPSAPRPSS